MACEHVSLPGGGANGSWAIVCGTRSTRKERCACGRVATLLCDWKVPGRRSGTCDATICANCSTVPASEKDLCPTHAAAFRKWSARQNSRRTA